MTPGRNRKRPQGNTFNQQDVRLFVGDREIIAYDGPPDTDNTDNPEFELFDPELQAVFDARFQAGIDLTERNDLAQIRATKQASLDCAARFRASAAKRAKGIATIRDNFESGRVTTKRRDRR